MESLKMMYQHSSQPPQTAARGKSSFAQNFLFRLGLALMLFASANYEAFAQCNANLVGISATTPTITVALNGAGSATLSAAQVSLYFSYAGNAPGVGCGSPEIHDFIAGGGIGAANISPLTFSCADIATTPRTYWFLYNANGTITDDNKVTFVITVVDNLPPAFTSCPSSITQAVTPGTCVKQIAVGLTASATDNCTPVTGSYTIAGTTSGSGTSLNANNTFFQSGVSVVTFRAVDSYGNVNTCTTTVTITEAVPPSITCPAPITVSAAAGTCNAVVTVPAPTLSDNCTTNAALTASLTNSLSGATTAATASGNGSGRIYNLGATSITYTVSDGSGNNSSTVCTAAVTVRDAQAPVITCPVSLTLSSGTACTQTATLAQLQASVTDNCSASGSYTYSFSGATISSGSGSVAFPGTFSAPPATNFNNGLTTVTYNISDNATPTANTASCTFTVVVQDVTVPMVSNSSTPTATGGTLASPAAAISATPGNCSVVVVNMIPYVSATDNCSNPVTITYILTGATTGSGVSQNGVLAPPPPNTAPNGLTYNAGITIVTYNVTDASGNVNQVTTTVTVYEGTPTLPVVTYPTAPITITAISSATSCGAVVTGLTPTFTDNCNPPGNNITLTYAYSGPTVTNLSGSSVPLSGTGSLEGFTFGVGTTNISYTLTDNGMAGPGNTTSVSTITVIVLDQTKPRFTTCPTNKVTNASLPGNNCTMPVVGLIPMASDNCSVKQMRIDVSGAGIFYAPDGSTTPSCFANCNAANGQRTNWHNWNGSNLGGTICTGTRIGNGLEGYYFNVGTSTVRYIVSDSLFTTINPVASFTHLDTCTFTVRVLETTAPVITCPSNFVVGINQPACKALVNPTPTISDAAACTRSCTNVSTQNIRLRYNYSGVTSGVIDTNTQFITTVGPLDYFTNNTVGILFNQGLTTLTATATDLSGNTSSCTFTVTVIDNTAPIIAACPSSPMTVQTDAGVCTRTGLTALNISATDPCSAPVSYNYSASGATVIPTTSGLGMSAVLSLGMSTVTLRAVDAAGNIASCVVTVTVGDSIAPVIVCPLNQTFNLPNGSMTCSATVGASSTPVINLMPTATDNCTVPTGGFVFNYVVATTPAGAIVASGTGVPASLTLTGSNVMTYSTADASGNTGTCSFTVTIADATPPSVAYASSVINLIANPVTCEANYSWYEPTQAPGCAAATDLCSGTSGITIFRSYLSGPNPNIVNGLINPGNGTVLTSIPTTTACPGQYQNTSFQVGTTVIRYTFTDQSGNPTTRDLTVIVTGGGAIAMPSCRAATVAPGTVVTPATVENPPVGGGGSCAATITNKLVNGLPSISFTCAQAGTIQSVILTYNYSNGTSQSCTALVTVSASTLAATVSTTTTTSGGSTGTATANPSGGTAPYTYLWNNGATAQNLSGLAANTYTVTVTDASGCTRSAAGTVTTAVSCAGFSVSVTPTATTAGNSNGSCTANVTGAQGAITYAWSNGGTGATISGLASGTYTVTATSAGCSAVGTATVNSSCPGMSATTSSTATSGGLNNGTATVISIMGGTGPYTYVWSNGGTSASISNLAAGSYFVTVTDAFGCTTSAAATVASGVPSCTGSVTATSTATSGGLNNGTATASVTGTTGAVTYSWAPGGATTPTISGLAPGTYFVTATNGTCNYTSSTTVQNGTTGGSTLAFTVNNTSGAPGTIINVPVTVTNFTNISDFQFSLHIADPTKAQIVGFTFTSIGTATSGFASNQMNGGNATIVWADPLGNGQTVPNGTTVFTIQVSLIGTSGMTTAFTIDGNPTQIAASTSVGMPPVVTSVTPVTTNGTLTITTGVSNFAITGSYIRADGAATPVGGVTTTMTGTTGATATNAASANTYSFTVGSGSNETITPTKPHSSINQCNNGVNTGDITIIQQHVLTTNLSLNTPYLRIAADVNNNGQVSSADIVAIRRVVLGTDACFSNAPSWVFIPQSFVFAPLASNPSTAFAPTGYPTSVSYSAINANQNAVFIGIKMGDVNYTAIASQLASTEEHSDKTLSFEVTDRSVAAGEEIEVPVTARNFDAISSYQGTINYDEKALEPIEMTKGELNDFGKDNYFVRENGTINTLWYDYRGASVKDEATLFTMKFKVLKNTTLSGALRMSSESTPAEAFLVGNERMNLDLTFKGNLSAVAAASEFSLLQNKPNPFSDATLINFQLPEATSATVRIFDMSGRVVKTYNCDCVKGMNELRIEKTSLPGTGVYYYQLSTSTQTASKKMILID